MFRNPSRGTKGLIAALLATTMLATGYKKEDGLADQDVSHSAMAATWDELDIRNDVAASFYYSDTAAFAPMATTIEPFAVNTTHDMILKERKTPISLLLRPNPLDRCLDVDSLLAYADAHGKTRMVMNMQQENPWSSQLPSDGGTTPYAAFAVDDLRAINDKMKRDARTLDVPDPKMLLWINGAVNLYNASCRPTAIGAQYPDHTVVVLTTGVLRAADKNALMDGEAHELAHQLAINEFNRTLYQVAWETRFNTLPHVETQAALTVLKAQRYAEYQCDSIAVTLSDNPAMMHRFLTLQERRRRQENETLIDSMTIKNMDRTVAKIFENIHQTEQEMTFRDDPFSTHPSAANRIRHMKLVQRFHESKDASKRTQLNDMMVKHPLRDRRNGYFLTAQF